MHVTQKSDLEQVEALDEAWNRAYVERDPQALDRLLADDWVGLTPGHDVITKEVLLGGQRQASAEAVITFTRGELRVFGDAAVTTGSTTVSAPGVAVAQRFTRIWSRRNGRWQAVAVQIVPLPLPQGTTPNA